MGEVSCHSSSLAVGVWDKWNLDHSVKNSKGVASLFNDAANLFKNGRVTSFVFYDFYKCQFCDVTNCEKC